MGKNALLLHGRAATPEDDWFPWLKNQLSWRGYDVWVPELPRSEQPDLAEWFTVVRSFQPTPETVIVGHGVGATFAFSMLERLRPGMSVKQVVSVAGFFLDDADWAKIRQHARRFDVLWSRDDHVVSEDATLLLARALDVEPMVFEGYGHFDAEVDTRNRQLPELAEIIFGFE